MSEIFTSDCDTKIYAPSTHARVFLEDMTLAICHTDKCDYRSDVCSHKRLSAELLKAMIDTYAALLEKNGYPEAGEILRAEM